MRQEVQRLQIRHIMTVGGLVNVPEYDYHCHGPGKWLNCTAAVAVQPRVRDSVQESNEFSGFRYIIIIIILKGMLNFTALGTAIEAYMGEERASWM